jgi:hypothetical protein
MTKETSPSYRAYLVRCWRDKSSSDEERPWHFSVEEVLHERRRKGFSRLEALFAFLQAELARDPVESSDQDQASLSPRPLLPTQGKLSSGEGEPEAEKDIPIESNQT